MRATDFEFRYRFWFIFLMFWAAFSFYWIDHRNAGVTLVRLLSSGRESEASVHAVFGLAALLVGIAALVRTWAAAYLQSERVHDANLRTEGVVADGPYRHLRNPLYLGNLLLAVGMGLVASRTGFVILVLGHVIFLLRLIGREESELPGHAGRRVPGLLRRRAPALAVAPPPAARERPPAALAAGVRRRDLLLAPLRGDDLLRRHPAEPGDPGDRGGGDGDLFRHAGGPEAPPGGQVVAPRGRRLKSLGFQPQARPGVRRVGSACAAGDRRTRPAGSVDRRAPRYPAWG